MQVKICIVWDRNFVSCFKEIREKEFLESYWNESENGMKRKFYTITDKGKKELQKKVNSWESVTALIQACQKGVIYE